VCLHSTDLGVGSSARAGRLPLASATDQQQCGWPARAPRPSSFEDLARLGERGIGRRRCSRAGRRSRFGAALPDTSTLPRARCSPEELNERASPLRDRYYAVARTVSYAAAWDSGPPLGSPTGAVHCRLANSGRETLFSCRTQTRVCCTAARGHESVISTERWKNCVDKAVHQPWRPRAALSRVGSAMNPTANSRPG
jgi:hypothetical protein